MGFFNVVTRSHICREFNCHKDTIRRWIKEEGFPEPLPCPAREPVFDADAVNNWIRGRHGCLGPLKLCPDVSSHHIAAQANQAQNATRYQWSHCLLSA